MVRTHGLSHIHLVVRDLDRALHFYQLVFGMQEAFRVPPAMVFLSTPGGHDLITLNQDDAEADKAGHSGGIAHFGFNLENSGELTEALEEVKRGGGSVLSTGEHAPGVPYAYVADPDGYVIELG